MFLLDVVVEGALPGEGLVTEGMFAVQLVDAGAGVALQLLLGGERFLVEQTQCTLVGIHFLMK